MKNQIVLLVTLLSASVAGSALPTAVQRMSLRDFCVTEGQIKEAPDGTLLIDDTKTRAVLGRQTQTTGTIDFRYLGPTGERSLLGSGAIRTQIGLKLKAQDPCNLVYVMWQIQPESRVIVSV